MEIISGVSSLNVLLAKLGLDMAFIGFLTLHVRGDISKNVKRNLRNIKNW
ncbi:MAG: hypothetical protein QXN74_08660 [Saccharolobus sp.]